MYIDGIGYVDEALFMMFATVFIVLAIYLLALIIIDVIGSWNIFKKAGEKGWKAIIPFYSTYTMFKIAWKPMWFWIYIGISVADWIIWRTGLRIGNQGMVTFSWVLTFVAILFIIPLFHQLSKSFGHKIGFTLGLIFLYPIFILILAFNKSQYVGPLSRKNEEIHVEPPHHLP